MTVFENNIYNIYGDTGKIWLKNLPNFIKKISARFNIKELIPLSNMTYHYVMTGMLEQTPVIIKLAPTTQDLKKEATVLNYFADVGAVKVIAEDNGFIILERVIPGQSLRHYFPYQDDEATMIAANFIKKLHQVPILDSYQLPHIRDWLLALDKNWAIPDDYLNKARALRNELLKSSNVDVLLHGDLHHDNLLKAQNSWTVIDPKGVIGESAYEIGAFIRNPIPEIIHQKNLDIIIKKRIDIFSKELTISSDRIYDWCFVQTVLAWIWSLEDNQDPILWEKMIQYFDH